MRLSIQKGRKYNHGHAFKKRMWMGIYANGFKAIGVKEHTNGFTTPNHSYLCVSWINWHKFIIDKERYVYKHVLCELCSS